MSIFSVIHDFIYFQYYYDYIICLILYLPESFRITDRGGGIPHNIINKIFQYNFTTAQDSVDPRVTGGTFGALTNTNAGTSAGPLCG